MGRKKWGRESAQEEMFRARLDRSVDPRHQLVKLGERIDWTWFEAQYAGQFGEVGRPPLPTRLVVALSFDRLQLESVADDAS